MSKWIPTPGSMATYVGRTKAKTRNVIVIAEAVRGCMVVEAIARKGINVRLTVSRDNLIEPQPDLFG
jgi:GTP cyclohydrolase I